MKILRVQNFGGMVEDYRLGERPVGTTNPCEFVKDIIYKDGNFTVVFSDDKEWFKTFCGMSCEYIEYGESKNRSNKERLQ